MREIAAIRRFEGNLLEIASKLKPDLGASIAINGACLSAVKSEANSFAVELSSHSREQLAIENFAPNARVHLEPALKYGDSIDGHLLQGHVDGIGTLIRRIKRESGEDFFFRLPEHLLPYVSLKGSIALDGVSLTISGLKGVEIMLSIIPISLAHTLFSSFSPGRRVHVETDLLARYAARILEFR